MKVGYRRCGARVRFDPVFLQEEEERREEKKVQDHRDLSSSRGPCNCAVWTLIVVSPILIFGLTEAVEDSG